MSKSSLVYTIPLLLIAIAAGAFWGTRAPEPWPEETAAVTVPLLEAATTAPALTVHVAGWVATPGLVRVPPGSRVADAVAAAGGFKPGADAGGVNLAAPVEDGERVIIPGPAGAGGEGASDGRAGTSGDGRVRVNAATAAELETLPGIGPVLAERIVAYRQDHGPFRTVEDLLDVPGIGESKLASLRDRVIVP
jgi:competence protein ComEA